MKIGDIVKWSYDGEEIFGMVLEVFSDSNQVHVVYKNSGTATAVKDINNVSLYAELNININDIVVTKAGQSQIKYVGTPNNKRYGHLRYNWCDRDYDIHFKDIVKDIYTIPKQKEASMDIGVGDIIKYNYGVLGNKIGMVRSIDGYTINVVEDNLKNGYHIKKSSDISILEKFTAKQGDVIKLRHVAFHCFFNSIPLDAPFKYIYVNDEKGSRYLLHAEDLSTKLYETIQTNETKESKMFSQPSTPLEKEACKSAVEEAIADEVSKKKIEYQAAMKEYIAAERNRIKYEALSKELEAKLEITPEQKAQLF